MLNNESCIISQLYICFVIQMTKPKLMVLSNGQKKSVNAYPVRRDTRITLSPLLSCIESEQASSDTEGLFLESSQIYASTGSLCLII